MQDKSGSYLHGASKPSSLSGKNREQEPCRWCGQERHSRTLCSERSEVCRNCRERCHYASVCLSRRLDCVETEHGTLEAGFHVAVKTTDTGNWETTILDQGQPVDFKIDTGANETVFSTHVFQTLKDRPLLSAAPRQLHGLDEATVKIIKTSTTKTKDPYPTLIACRSTPLKNGYSPAKLLMGRRLRSRFSLCSTKLTPQWPDQDSLRNFEERYRQRQRKDFDRRHGVCDLPEHLYGDAMWVTDLKSKGTVQAPADEPRSY
ncbi:hypothetical protein MRX96_031211 [Rhipicephalus microplus]